jgi:hypothetical protein
MSGRRGQEPDHTEPRCRFQGRSGRRRGNPARCWIGRRGRVACEGADARSRWTERRPGQESTRNPLATASARRERTHFGSPTGGNATGREQNANGEVRPWHLSPNPTPSAGAASQLNEHVTREASEPVVGAEPRLGQVVAFSDLTRARWPPAGRLRSTGGLRARTLRDSLRDSGEGRDPMRAGLGAVAAQSIAPARMRSSRATVPTVAMDDLRFSGRTLGGRSLHGAK